MDEAGENGPGDLDVHGGGHAEVVGGAVGELVLVLGRAGWAGDEVAGVRRAGWRGGEVVEKEEHVFAEAGIGSLPEEGSVSGVVVVIPEVEGEPRSAHGPDAPAEGVDGGGVAPDVGVVMDDGAAGFVDEIEEWSVEGGEVGAIGQPVVHLGVDVDGVLRAPRRIDRVVPDALEIGGEGAWARA